MLRWAVPLAVAIIWPIACAAAQTPPVRATVAVAGVILLPPGSAAGALKIEVREGAAPQAPIVGEARLRVRPGEAEARFVIEIDRARLRPRGEYRLRAALIAQGRVAAIGGPIRLQAQGDRIEVGAIPLAPLPAPN